jgi:hypothetical protein
MKQALEREDLASQERTQPPEEMPVTASTSTACEVLICIQGSLLLDLYSFTRYILFSADC